ncbi:MAG: glycosyltransferase [Polyangiaceae bacterium]|jgi:glycosyltransferase involved in cell wall biosynthesis|nr:glycosyltransferase [Polyangiaceae bacterium]
MATALLVTYMWPPSGGVGVGRVLKLAKYLPSHGVTPSVLTVANPSVPVQDTSMLKDVPPGTEVLYARTFEPSYATKQATWQAASGGSSAPVPLKRRLVGQVGALARHLLVPDPQVLWQPDAQRALVQRLRSPRAEDVVFITAPPFSAFLAAPAARAAGKAAIVLDYRDEWLTIRSQFEMMGALSRALGGPLEHLVLRSAHMVTTATDAFRDNLLSHFRFLDPARVVTIENGFDTDDFPATLPEPPGDRFVVTYAGSVLVQNSPRGLLGAVRRLHEREPELAKLLQVDFIGRVVDTELVHFEGSERLGVRRLGFIPKDAVMPALAASHMVLCLLDEMPGAERIYPAKIFELLYLDRPCLTLAPEGALTSLVRQTKLGPVLAPRDEEAICAELERALRLFKDGRFPTRAGAVGVERYDRRAIAGRFADVFREATALARRS